MSTSKSPSQRRYPPELRERAVRMVREAIAENGGERFGVVTRIARQLGIGAESLRTWGNQAEVDDGRRPGGDHCRTGWDRRSGEGKSGTAAGERDPEERVGFFRGRARRPTSEMIRYIDEHREKFGVEPICQVLEIAPSTYYEARSRPASP